MEEEVPPPPKKGILSKKQDAPDLSGFRNEINSISARLRLLEEGFANLRRMSQITEENLISKNKHYNTEFKTMTSDILDSKKEIQDVKDKVLLIIKELQTAAKKEDVKVLEKYVNLWNPIKFATHNEVDAIVEDALNKNQN
tara:strand:- start:1142 stop:1564 length:423 start_codon:yes stop_codon:yes gene_type:complete